EVIRTNAGIFDARGVPDYYRILPEGRLLWGGRAAAFEPHDTRIGRLLHRDLAYTYPRLSKLRIEEVWAGRISVARHQMPIIVQFEEGIWAASGFGGHGLATTTLAGNLI